jgi:signal transduction histidine kinase
MLTNAQFGQAQQAQNLFDTISLSQVKLSQSIQAQTGIYIDTANIVQKSTIKALPHLNFVPVSMSRKLPAKLISKTIYLQFSVRNDSDTVSFHYFLPGFYCNSINLYKYSSTTALFEPVPAAVSQKAYNDNVVSVLNLLPHETATFITALRFIKTTVNTITPTISEDFYLNTLFSQLQNERRLNSIITYLICGIMLMMIIYSFAGYYTSRSMEFIYYAGYAFLLGFMFFFKALLYKLPVVPNFLFESYLDFLLQGTGTVFYFIFLRSFTNARRDFPKLNRFLLAQQWLTVAGLALFTYLNFFTDQFPLQNQVENLIKYAWSFGTIIFIGFAICLKSNLLKYLAIGHAFLFLFGFLSLYLINSPRRFMPMLTSVVNDSLFWYEMGVLFELVFFMIALSIKNKQNITLQAREKERLLIDYDKSAMQRKMEILAAQQEERNRISADMHDELGSGVTAIRLLSELAKTKLKENTPTEIDKISNSANDLIMKMNTIIWTMKSANDTVDNMVAYVRAYASEFLDNTNLHYIIDYPDVACTRQLSGEKRRNIFLCIKEALNNIAKHAQATKVELNFDIGDRLVVTIKDNGIGLNPEKMREFSNGLVNMQKRMENIDGQFSISTGDGTLVSLSIPLI